MNKSSLSSSQRESETETKSDPPVSRTDTPAYPPNQPYPYPYPMPWAYPSPYLLPPDYLYLQHQLLLLHQAQAQKDYLHPGHYPTNPYPVPPLHLPHGLPLPYPWTEGPQE